MLQQSHTKQCQVQGRGSFMENEMAATNDFVSSKVSSPSGRRTAQAVRYATADKVIQALHMTVVCSQPEDTASVDVVSMRQNTACE